MIEPADMLLWIDKRIASAQMWLDDFSEGRRKRPDMEIEQKQFDIQALSEIRLAYQKALDRRNQTER